MKLDQKTFITWFIIVAVAVCLKLLAAANYNFSGFTGIFAVMLFSATTIKNKPNTFLLPLVTLFLSDLFVQFFYWAGWFEFPGFYKDQLLNYILILAAAGVALLFSKGSMNTKIAGIIIVPTFFFLVSNFFVWKLQGAYLTYSNDMPGLIKCYTAALPFYRNSLISTSVLVPLFMLVHKLVAKGKPVLE